MSYEHKDLANGRWGELPFLEQMANIGSEVERALNWRMKNNAGYSRHASDRALELLDLTLDSVKTPARLRELARAREAIVDYFYEANQYGSSEIFWRKYFSNFAYAACKDR